MEDQPQSDQSNEEQKPNIEQYSNQESQENNIPLEQQQQQQEERQQEEETNKNDYSPDIKLYNEKLCLDFSPKLKLKTLFIFYCSFGTRLNLTHLSLQKFQKLLEDANILDEQLNAHQLNIIVLQTTHSRVNSIDFQVFLDLLPKISAFKFNLIENTIAAFEALLEHHLFPLFHCIIEQTDLGKELQILNQPLEDTTIRIILHLCPQFARLYYIYFKQELAGGCQKNDLIMRSLKALAKFLQEFEICPPLISKSAMNLVYFNIVEMEQTSKQLISPKSVAKALQAQNISNGIIFTFNKLLTFIIRASIIAFNSFNEIKTIQNEDLIDDQSQPHKLLFLLNRMQISSGFQMVEKRTDRPHQQRFTFQISNQKLESLLGINQSQSSMVQQSQIQQQHSPSMSSFNQFGFFLQSQQQTNQSIHLKQQLFLNPSQITLQNSRSQNQFFSDENLSSIPQDAPIPSNLLNPQLCQILDFHQSSLQIFQQNHEQLLKIFQYYCSLGEPLNLTKLKSFKLAKLLKSAGLLQQLEGQPQLQQKDESQEQLLSLTDMDLIFSKLTGTKLQQLIQESSHQPKWDKNIRSPVLCERRHLSQFESTGANKNCMGKLEYEQFLKSLELIAIKLYPETLLSDSLPLILNKYILAQDLQNPEQVKERAAGTYHIQLLMQLLNDHEVVTLLNEVHKPIELIFTYYCNHKQQMNFDQFINFAKEFDIFPDIISKSKLLRIFYALSSIYQSQNQEISFQQSSILKSNYGLSIDSMCFKDQYNPNSNSTNFIDSHLFVESIALCSLEVPYFEPQPSNIEKIIYLLQRLNSSNKYQSIQKQLGYKTKNSFKLNLLTSVIKKYTSILSITNFYDEEPETFEDFIKQTKFEK